MEPDEFINMLDEEVTAIISDDFAVEITIARAIPHIEDPAITYANLDTGCLRCKAIDTCILHVDLRQSTAMNLGIQHEELAKLYTCFVRAMALCAARYGGSVRGIVGDRVMVAFELDGCCTAALNAAVTMDRVVREVLDKRFRRAKIRCGIGIHYGKMLVIKAGIIKQKQENADHKSLVWLGPPANVASKLADQAGKPLTGSVSVSVPSILITASVFKGYFGGLPPEQRQRALRSKRATNVSIPHCSDAIYGWVPPVAKSALGTIHPILSPPRNRRFG